MYLSAGEQEMQLMLILAIKNEQDVPDRIDSAQEGI